jgi:hypothetical protein
MTDPSERPDPALEWLLDHAALMTPRQRDSLLSILLDASIGAGESTDTDILARVETYQRAMAHLAIG